MHLTKRDKDILRFVEQHKSITITQTAKLFFSNCKQDYYQARKRLKLLSDNKHLKRYRQDMKSQSIYYLEKKLSVHDLKILDVYSELFSLGAEITNFKTEYIIPTKSKYYRADALMEFTYNDFFYPLLVEVDYTHFTSSKKLLDIYNSHHFQNLYAKEYGDTNIFPAVLIIRPVIPYSPFKTELFDIHYTQFNSIDLAEIL